MDEYGKPIAYRVHTIPRIARVHRKNLAHESRARALDGVMTVP